MNTHILHLMDQYDDARKRGGYVGNEIASAIKRQIVQSHQPDGWVACSERMPGVGQEVVVVNQNGYVRSCQLRRGWGRNEGKLYWDGHSGVGLDHFTHWQPLPSAPKGTP